jgi:hypothetical protein
LDTPRVLGCRKRVEANNGPKTNNLWSVDLDHAALDSFGSGQRIMYVADGYMPLNFSHFKAEAE